MLGPDPNPEPECVPLQLRQKGAVPFLFHNTTARVDKVTNGYSRTSQLADFIHGPFPVSKISAKCTIPVCSSDNMTERINGRDLASLRCRERQARGKGASLWCGPRGRRSRPQYSRAGWCCGRSAPPGRTAGSRGCPPSSPRPSAAASGSPAASPSRTS
jgi:hypothetical protein